MSLLLSFLDSLSLGYDTNSYENEIASNLEEYINSQIFLVLQLDVLERIISKQTKPISYSSGKNFLKHCVQNFGLQSIVLLKYLRVDPLDEKRAKSLLKIFNQCPIISYLNSEAESDNEENENPFLLSLSDTTQAKNNDFDSTSLFLDDIFTACKKGDHIRVLECIKEDPEVISTRDSHMNTPLHVAVLSKQYEACKTLLENGANPNAISSYDYTPLHYSCMNEAQDIVELLLNHNADVAAAAENGLTPLHLASGGTNLKICEILVEKGADVNATGKNGETPLSEAKDEYIIAFLRSKDAY
ncbi:hypothetical protein TVAG_405970 [Trichomonas vaginalis G3]|uniref:Uncharacterized protein n=1 Tax=Trichomonas vaginalis (strain ATCC PRA-98 / G3) TaxID=412133 RepID=A2DV87_TRIV3|nr:integrin-mediated signaling pathway [Trichomonas vaginalis G3]EAY15683.1 hypothetical protein TVAG_405970 [Trichomonas vaginalis G3]KAI5504533.1 integrin-mediated signaling pathway [Trichomonas vaginalis G3]|eukprot:XP_001327906.1 hypothetical protein [Trichomonas vaginalis G3]